MKTSKLRFAIIGCGVIAPTHAYCIHELPDTEITAVCDLIPERAERLAQAFGGEIYTDYQVMLQRKDIDVVVVCTPSGLHADIGIAAARSGKHVIVEKPIDVSLAKADQLIQACQQAGVRLSSISQHRFDPAVVDLRAAVNDGKLGVLNFGGSYTQWYRSQEYYNSGDWRGTWALDGGGALINQSIHYIDLLQFIMGPVMKLHGYCAMRAHTHIEVEDTAIASLKFKSGALGIIEGMTSAYPGFCTRLEVFGNQGGVVIEDDKVKEWRLSNGESYITPAISGPSIASTSSMDIWPEGHRRQLENIITAIRENHEPAVNGVEGRKPLEIVLAIYESARTGKTIYF
jgi:UDP-N-acetyl-2-amino-2-deoxyglucuronate dehydrogenase